MIKHDGQHPSEVVEEPTARDIGNTCSAPLVPIDTPAVKKAFDNLGSVANC